MTKPIKEPADDLPRIYAPRKNEKPPGPAHVILKRPIDPDLVEEPEQEGVSDTGGGLYRPRSRMQDPAKDPYEPWSGAGPDDSASRGYEHGWNNCLMTSGGIGLDFHTLGAKRLWGGQLRHHQDDMVGGTDILDLKTAWARLGFTLSNRSGQGWVAVRAARTEYRGIMLQGRGNVPGAGTYTGAHAIYVNPDRSSTGKWLICDPLVAGWQWVNEQAVKDWARRLNSAVQFAVTRARRP